MVDSDNNNLEIHIILGTHWDREWLFSFQETRYRLINMLETVIELLEKNKEVSFTLDGQVMAVDDYLELRPQNQHRIESLVGKKRLFIGPWYSLPDVPVLCGESIVRNLLYGITRSQELGKAMFEGLSNTSWGQISQMPQILQGFGINSYYSYHGVPAHKLPTEFLWEGADGSSVIFVRSSSIGRGGFWQIIESAIRPDEKEIWASIKSHSNLLDKAYRMTDILPVKNSPFYSDDTNLPRDYEAMCKKFKEILNKTTSDKRNTHHLFMGTFLDSGTPNYDIDRMVEELRKRYPELNIHFSSVPEFFRKVKNAAQKFQVFKGEMRYPAKDNDCFRLVYAISSRMYLKQLNRQAEHLLTKWLEPFSTFNWLNGQNYPYEELKRAWQMMFVNQSHDNIGGCSVDHVHDDMVTRYNQITELGQAVLHRTLGRLSQKVGSREILPNEFRLVVFNPASCSRSDVIEANLLVSSELQYNSFDIFDENNNRILCKILKTQKHVGVAVQLPIQSRPEMDATVAKVAIEAKNIPPLGFAEYKVVPVTKAFKEKPVMPAGNSWMENDYLKVTVRANGTFNLIDKVTGEIFKNLHYFEDGSQAKLNPSNPWYYVPAQNDAVLTSRKNKVKVKLLTNTAFLTQLRIEYDFHIPKQVKLTKKGEIRSKTLVALSIISILTLKRNSRRVDIETTVDNCAQDHRLRVMFPSNINTRYSWADSPYDVVRRPITMLGKPDWLEAKSCGSVTLNPMLSFVDLASRNRSLAVITDGLTEYEILQDQQRTIAITLLRSFFYPEYNNPDLPARRMHGSQCQGIYSFRYAVYPHKNNWEQGGVMVQAQSHSLPLKAIQVMRSGSGQLPPRGGLLDLTSDKLDITAIKKSQNGDDLIVRILNPTSQAITAKLVCHFTVLSAKLVNLLEKPLQGKDLKVTKGNVIPLTIMPKKILTLRIKAKLSEKSFKHKTH